MRRLALSGELIDEARYLANRNDLLKLLQKVYGDNDVTKIITVRQFHCEECVSLLGCSGIAPSTASPRETFQ